MLHVLQQQHPGAVPGCSRPPTRRSIAWRCTRSGATLLEAQAAPPACRCTSCRCPGRARTSDYEARMGDRRATRLVADGFTHVAFGDLFLEDVRRYREERLAGTGLTPLFPLWKTKPTADLAREMIDGGLRARLTCVDPRELDRVVRRPHLRRGAARRSAGGVDPCGENGEFHSFAYRRPDVHRIRLTVVVGEVVDRDGFVFCRPRAWRA